MKFRPSKKAPCSAELRRELDSIWKCINERKLNPTDGQSFSQYTNGFTFSQKRKITPAGAAQKVFLMNTSYVESAHVISYTKNLDAVREQKYGDRVIGYQRVSEYLGLSKLNEAPQDSGFVEGHPWLLVTTRPDAYEALGPMQNYWELNDLSRRGIARAWLPPMSWERFLAQMISAGNMRYVADTTTGDALNNLEYEPRRYGWGIVGEKVSHGKIPLPQLSSIYYNNAHHKINTVGAKKGQWKYNYWNASNPLRTIDFDGRAACTQVPVFTAAGGSNLDYISGPHAIGLSGDFWEFVKQ